MGVGSGNFLTSNISLRTSNRADFTARYIRGGRKPEVPKKTVRDVEVRGKRVFVRVDFNVPLDENLQITNDKRIREALPTINYLTGQDARVILASHLGRPKGQVNDKMRLDPVAARLSELLGRQVAKVNEVIGPEVTAAVKSLQPGEVLLLENVRFLPGEEKNSPELAKALAALADLYVNDAFGTAHRAHASTAGVAEYLPAVAGLLMEKEVNYLGLAVTNPEKPFLAIIGGAKVSDKIGVIENLLGKVNALIIGGGMANTFLQAKGLEIGASLYEADKVELATGLLQRATAAGVRLLLPVDVVVATGITPSSEHHTVPADQVPADLKIVDIGPQTITAFAGEIARARTIIWNGPMGVFETPEFARGTMELAKAVAANTGTTVIGGGDSVAAVEKAGVAEKISHISTGGGASLEFLEGRTLPGVAVLQDV